MPTRSGTFYYDTVAQGTTIFIVTHARTHAHTYKLLLINPAINNNVFHAYRTFAMLLYMNNSLVTHCQGTFTNAFHHTSSPLYIQGHTHN